MPHRDQTAKSQGKGINAQATPSAKHALQIVAGTDVDKAEEENAMLKGVMSEYALGQYMRQRAMLEEAQKNAVPSREVPPMAHQPGPVFVPHRPMQMQQQTGALLKPKTP
jgi:hypothetical protein